jgi:hypothetical protein
MKGTMKQSKGYHIKPLMNNQKEIKFSSMLSSVKLRNIKELAALHTITKDEDNYMGYSNETRSRRCWRIRPGFI